MVGILLRVLGRAILVTTAAYMVYKTLTREQIRKDVVEEIGDSEDIEALSNVVDIFIKAKLNKGDYFTVGDIDRWAKEPTVIVDVRDESENALFKDIIISGDEFGNDIRVGTVISL